MGEWGNPIKKLKSRDNFCKLTKEIDMVDIGSTGPVYTWSNKRSYKQLVKVSLDKCYARRGWLDLN